MRELMSSFLSNDSAFGRVMTHCGVVIGANIMFVLFSLPVITAGASYTALEYTIFRMERGDGVINPFKEFWKGFRMNWKQATITSVIAAILGIFLLVDIRIAVLAGGALAVLRYPLYALLIIEISLLIWIFPAIASFKDTLPHLVRNSVYFSLHRIWKLPILLFFHLFSFYLSFTDVQMQPLYAFIWSFFGFGLLAALDAKLILPEFVPYLPAVDEYGDFIIEPESGIDADLEASIEAADSAAGSQAAQKSEKEILEEMQRLGM